MRVGFDVNRNHIGGSGADEFGGVSVPANNHQMTINRRDFANGFDDWQTDLMFGTSCPSITSTACKIFLPPASTATDFLSQSCKSDDKSEELSQTFNFLCNVFGKYKNQR